MKKHDSKLKFLGGAGVLTAAALAGKLIGALYRIPLTRIIGAQGMGMYQSVFPMYALLVTFTGGGLTAAVSKLVAENEGKEACAFATLFSLCVSVAAALVAAVFARNIANAAGAPQAATALLLLLPGVPLSAVCAVFRGYFQGNGNMYPSAFGQLIEQIAKLAAGLSLALALSRVSLAAATAGCAAGVTVSEAVSVLYYFLRYKKRERKNAPATVFESEYNVSAQDVSALAEPVLSANSENVFFSDAQSAEVAAELSPATLSAPALVQNSQTAVRTRKNLFSGRRGELLAKLLKIACPITFGLMVLPLCHVADSFVIVNLLMRSGAEHSAAVSFYGLVTGPVNAIVNMPAVLSVGLCGTLLPKVSRLIGKGEKVGGVVLRVTLLSAAMGAICFAGIAVGAPIAIKVLYGNELGVPLGEASALLRLAAVSVPATAVMQAASAVLQGGGKAYFPAMSLLVAAVVKEALNFMLLPRAGIYGFVLATDAFYLLACALDCVALIFFVHKTDKSSLPTRK